MCDEIGKPITLAYGEIDRAITTFRLAGEALETYGPQALDLSYDSRGSQYHAETFRVPVGPVLAITPYNWPINLSAHKIAPGLAMGNTILHKVSPKSPLTSLALARIIHEAGCPAGVYNAIACSDKDSERAVLDSRIPMISFTGSDHVGWHIAKIAWNKKLILELGGDAFALVWHDADLQNAASKLSTSAFAYAGQVCISTQNILIHESIYSEFRTNFQCALSHIKVGDPKNSHTICGPIIDETATNRIISLVEDAMAQGATCLVPIVREKNLVHPIVLERVPDVALLSKIEVFGPVVCFHPVSSLQSAITRINASPFGIQASVFSKDQMVISECISQFNVSGVIVNDSPSVRFDGMPYGGCKASGRGREGIQESMLEYSQPKVKVERLPDR